MGWMVGDVGCCIGCNMDVSDVLQDEEAIWVMHGGFWHMDDPETESDGTTDVGGWERKKKGGGFARGE